MNEEVMISIKANASSFQSAMQGVINDINLATKDMQEFSAIVDNANKKQMNDITKNIKAGIKETTAIIKDMQRELVIATQTKASPEMIARLKQDISVANGELTEMNAKLKSLGKSMPSAGMSKFFDGMKSRLGALGTSIARTGKLLMTSFAFAAFGTLRRGFGDAIKLSDTAGSKFASIANVIGASLVPVIDAVARGFQKALVWVAGFIKALTGFNMLQKGLDATNKKIGKMGTSIAGTTKATKGMLGGLDEITNIDTDTGSSGGGGAGIGEDMANQLGAIGDLNEMMKQMEALDFGWVTPLKNFFSWMIENWQFVVVGIAGITLAIAGLKISSLLASVGLTGLLTPIMAIVLGITGLIAIVLGVIELFKEGGNQTKAWTLILGGLLAIVGAIGLVFGLVPMAIAALIAAVLAGILWMIKNWDTVKEAFRKGCEMIGNFFSGLWTGIVNIFKGIGAWFGARITEIVSFFQTLPSRVATWFTNTINSIKGIFGSIGAWFGQKVNDIVNAFSGVVSRVGKFFTNLFSNIKSTFTNIGQTVGKFISNTVSGAVKGILTTATNIINGFIKGINVAIGLINKIPGVKITKLNLMNVPSFDVGTPNVPHDMLAQIHKGEAIIPEKFNDEKFFGNNDVDMSETNSLLEELIQVMRSKSFSISKGEVGRASLEYIKQQSRLRGEVVL